MKELIVEILKIVAPVSVGLIVFTSALLIAPGQVLWYFKERPGLMLKALAAGLILVPLAALALILVLKPPTEVAIGLAILVACPPAPLMINAVPNLGKGSAAFLASIHLGLAALAFVTVPIVLYLISIPLKFNADVNLGTMAWVLARTILIPIILGTVLRGMAPRFADKFGPILGKIGTIGLLVVVLFALFAFYPALLKMSGWSYLVIALVSVAALAIGHFLGPDNPHEKTTLAIECGVRHPVLALTIAGANFGPQNAAPVLVPCVLTFIALAMVYLVIRGKFTASGKSAPAGAVS